MSQHSEPFDTLQGVRRWPRGTRLILAVVVPCALFILLQFVGLVVFVANAAHTGPFRSAPDSLGQACSILVWLILVLGLVNLVTKLRGARAHRRHSR